MLGRERPQLPAAGHRPVGGDDLPDDGHRLLPGEGHQVQCGLGVSGTDQDAAVATPQREDVPRTAQLPGCGGRVGERTEGAGPVGGRHTGAAVAVVDGDRERRAVRIGVVALGDHRRQAQRIGTLGGHRGAEDAGGVPHDERHLLGGDGRGGQDQVTLVLAVGVVDDHDHPTGGDRRDGLLDGPRGGKTDEITGLCHG